MAHITWGIILACGKDEQLTSGTDTAFVSLGSQPALTYSLLAYEQCPDIDGIMVVARKERMETVVGMVRMFGVTKVRKVVPGSASRKITLQNALKALDEDVTILSVHDASRPCITEDLVSETVKAAKRYGSGVAALRLTEPVKQVERGQKVTASFDAGKLWVVQKPQSYKREVLERALAAGNKTKKAFEDESEAVEAQGHEIRLVPGHPHNVRIRSVDDLSFVTALLSQGTLPT